MSKYQPELGQLAFGNTWQNLTADWAIDGLRLISEALYEKFGTSKDTGMEDYGYDYANIIFTMRSYSWEEDEKATSLPNFEYLPFKMQIHWYKYIGRGMSCNMQRPSCWPSIVAECINSIK